MEKNRICSNYKQSVTHFLQGVVILVSILILSASCSSLKNLQYLQGNLDTAKLSKLEIPEAKIQKGDLLNITLYSDNQEATAAVTMLPPSTAVISGGNISAGQGLSGHLVDSKGNIQLFKLGIIPVEGKTQKQVADTLASLYVRDSLLRNPYVEVRFLNYRVTLIGEVNRPGTYSVAADKVSVFEAIGLAGDITSYGRRNNVKVIRETNGVRKFGQLDLSNPEVFLSPFFYLEQNDMVIVDVTKNKSTVNDQILFRNISLASTALSMALLIYSIFTN